MSALKFYEALLASNTAIITDDGKVLKPNKTKTPFKVGGKEVVLPTVERLRENVWDEIHPFHPLCEDVMMGQSPTLHLLMDIIKRNLTSKYTALIQDILTVSSNKDLQSKIVNPKAIKILSAYPEAKAGAVKSWAKVRTKVASSFMLNCYISRSVVIDDIHYQRSGVVTCPILETREESSILGVQVTKKDAAGIYNLVYILLDDLCITYNSNHTVPYLDVLLQHYGAAVKRYNDVVEMFSPVITSEPIDYSWMEYWKDVETIRKAIPRLPGNAGTKIETTITTGAEDVKLVEGTGSGDIFDDVEVKGAPEPVTKRVAPLERPRNNRHTESAYEDGDIFGERNESRRRSRRESDVDLFEESRGRRRESDSRRSGRSRDGRRSGRTRDRYEGDIFDR